MTTENAFRKLWEDDDKAKCFCKLWEHNHKAQGMSLDPNVPLKHQPIIGLQNHVEMVLFSWWWHHSLIRFYGGCIIKCEAGNDILCPAALAKVQTWDFGLCRCSVSKRPASLVRTLENIRIAMDHKWISTWKHSEDHKNPSRFSVGVTGTQVSVMENTSHATLLKGDEKLEGRRINIRDQNLRIKHSRNDSSSHRIQIVNRQIKQSKWPRTPTKDINTKETALPANKISHIKPFSQPVFVKKPAPSRHIDCTSSPEHNPHGEGVKSAERAQPLTWAEQTSPNCCWAPRWFGCNASVQNWDFWWRVIWCQKVWPQAVSWKQSKNWGIESLGCRFTENLAPKKFKAWFPVSSWCGEDGMMKNGKTKKLIQLSDMCPDQIESFFAYCVCGFISVYYSLHVHTWNCEIARTLPILNYPYFLWFWGF